MAKLTIDRLRALRDRHAPVPAIFVETGTWTGRTALMATRLFPAVHTIELNPALFREHAGRLEASGVTCYQGDSARILPTLAASLGDGVCWFLDAHWTAQRAGAARGRFPLWAELDAIGRRPTGADVVIVDDVHCFGGKGPEAAWQGVTLETIAARFPGAREAAVVGDQAVVYR